MDNIKMQDAENVKDQSAEALAAVTSPLPKAPRGRPPGRSRKESLPETIQPTANLDTLTNTNGNASDNLLQPRRINGRVARLGRGKPTSGRVNNDKPIFTLSVAAEILHLHPRTLRIYEEHDLVVPTRTQTNRRRYSQNDIKKFQFIQYLTRERGVNLSGVKIILVLLEEVRKTISDPISHIFPDYGESEGFPLL